MSLPQVLLWQELRKEPGGFRFRRQSPQFEYRLDFACLETRLAIEVEGEFHARGDRPQRDARRDERLAELGFVTLRVPASKILKDLNAVVTGIVDTCRERGPSTTGLPPAVPLPVPGRNERMRMKLLLLAALLAPCAAAAQTTPTPKLPPANPVPYEDADAAAVLAPINATFAALETGDRAALLRHVYPDGRVTASDGKTVRQQSWTQFAERVSPERTFVERITNPAIDRDDNIAMVWAPFTVRIAGKVVSCGTNHFDLVREGAAWKVMNVTYSARTTGCPGQ